MITFTKPMKAGDANLDGMKYPVLALPKYDGVRALNREGSILARTLKRFKNKALNAYFDSSLYDGLDGEMLVGDITSQSACRDTTSVVNSFDKPIDDVVWYLFDMLSDETIDLPYIERHAAAVEWVKQHNNPLVQVIAYETINNRAEADAIIEKHAAMGLEGTIFRNPQGKHKNGRSTPNDGGDYWRDKGFVDEECVVVSLNEAMENQNAQVKNELGLSERSTHQENMIPKGMIGSLNCRSKKWGDFIVGSGEMSHEERILYWNNQEHIIGQQITFKYFPHGVKDKPRFPTFKCFRDGDQ